jgi:type IV pilus assembly protein PilN
MVKINLFPKKSKPPITLIRDSIILLATVLAVILIIGQFSMGLSRKLDRLKDDKVRVEKGIAATKKKIKNINQYKKKIKDINRKIAVINELKDKQTGPVILFKDLSMATPEQLWLTSLKNTSTSIKLDGMAFTPNTVSEFMQNLSKSPYFTKVELNNITQKAESGRKVQVFSINCKIKYKLDKPEQENTEQEKKSKKK